MVILSESNRNILCRLAREMPASIVQIRYVLGTLAFRWYERWRKSRLYRTIAKNAPIIVENSYGIRLILYPWDRAKTPSLICPTHEKSQYEATSLLVRPGDIVFDVGAHIGRFTVFASRLSSPRGMVFAFEPVPDTYWRLCETLTLNRCQAVVPSRKAICDRVGLVQMNLFEPQYSAWNTMGRPLMSTPEGQRVAPKISITVPSDTLDHFCCTEGINRVNFLKVDVEGFEEFVLRGAEHLLGEQRIDYICFEVSQDPLRGAGVTARGIFELLERHGYLVYEFHERSRTFQGPVQDSTEYWMNYFASHQDLSTLPNGSATKQGLVSNRICVSKP